LGGFLILLIVDVGSFNTLNTSGESEIGYFYGTILIDEDISGFKVSMQYLGGVEVLESG